jgi:hypothetical protein
MAQCFFLYFYPLLKGYGKKIVSIILACYCHVSAVERNAAIAAAGGGLRGGSGRAKCSFDNTIQSGHLYVI